jgi:Holliday junction resolvasome RuvABC endonuclease subunit
MIRVLALDTSTHTGFAHCSDDPAKPVFGTFHLPGWRRESVGKSYAALHRFISAKIAEHRFTHVVIERPLTVHAHAQDAGKNADLAAALLGFVAIAECAAEMGGARCHVESPSTIRKHFVGNGRPKDPKAAVMARCRQLGWRIMDDNQADALATWDYAVAHLKSRLFTDASAQ